MSEWTVGFVSGALAAFCSLSLVNSDWGTAIATFVVAVVFVLVEPWMKAAD